MKKSLTLFLVIVALAVFTCPGVAQQQEQQKYPTSIEMRPAPPKRPLPQEATTIRGSKSNSSERLATDNASPNLLTGKVTEVNNQAKTFTISVVFSAEKLSKLPTVGEIFDITYTQTPDGRLKMLTCAREIANSARLCAAGIQKAQ